MNFSEQFFAWKSFLDEKQYFPWRKFHQQKQPVVNNHAFVISKKKDYSF